MDLPKIKITPRTVYDVQFPDGSTLIMDQVDRWPEGLVRLRDLETGNALVAALDSSDGGTEGGSLLELFSETFGFIKKADVLYAASQMRERLNPETNNG